MTFRTTTLSAALALAASGVLAQEARTITVPLGDPAPATDGAGFTYSTSPSTDGTPSVAAPTGEAPPTTTGRLVQSPDMPAAISEPTPETAAAPGAGDEAPAAEAEAAPAAEAEAAAPAQAEAAAEADTPAQAPAQANAAEGGTGAAADGDVTTQIDPAAGADVAAQSAKTHSPEAQAPVGADTAAGVSPEGETAVTDPEVVTPEGSAVAEAAQEQAQPDAEAGVEPGETPQTGDAAEGGTIAAEGTTADNDPGTLGEPAAEVQGSEAGPGVVAPVDNAERADPTAPEGEAAAGHETHITDVAFSFEGPFGTYDQFQLQRGLQVYTEVCAGCHGMQYVPLRTLSDPDGPGLPEDQVRAFAAGFDITDSETGEDRPRLPTDHFPRVTGEGMGPDLSLLAKGRAGFHGPYGTGLSQLFNGMGGPEYIYSVLTGYTGETKEEAGATFYENTAFPGGWIQMPPPLSDDQVTYEDGHPATVQTHSEDVAAFLMWAAEPKMMDRKRTGFIAVIFLVLLSSLLYLTNKRLWWPIKHGSHGRS